MNWSSGTPSCAPGFRKARASNCGSARFPGELQKRVASLIKMGCRTSIQLLPSQWGAVAAAYAQHDGLHFTVVGASARRTLVEALEGALDELETLAYVRFHDQEVPPLVPSTVKSPTDHTSIYALKRYYRRADPVMATTDFDSFARRAKLADAKDSIAHRLISAGREVVVVDIAAPHSSIDQGRTPVFVVRTLVPGLVPISFGFNREPLGMVEVFDRRSRFPHPFP